MTNKLVDLAAKVLGIGIRAMLLFIVLVVVISAILFFAIGSNISGAVEAVTGRVYFISEELAWLIKLIAIEALAIPAARLLLDILLQRANWRHYVILSVLAGVGVIFSYYTRGDLLAPGAESRYICPPALAGDLPEIRKTSASSETGENCTLITPENARVAQQIIRLASPPPRKRFFKSSEMDGVFVFRNGTQYLYKSAATDDNRLPILFAGPWFDDATGGLLLPAQNMDIQVIRDFLKKQEQEAAIKAAEQSQARESADASYSKGKASMREPPTPAATEQTERPVREVQKIDDDAW